MIHDTLSDSRTAPAATLAAAHRRIRGWALPAALIQACVIVLVVVVGAGAVGRDPGVPLHFSSDSLVYMSQAKSTIDNGWWWVNHRLGAPFVYDALLLPSNSNVDQAVVWAVSLFVREFPLSLNVSWLAIVVFSGFAATFCLRSLGVSQMASLAVGTLFALSPYALYRHLGHFSLVIYLVPFPAALAVQLASGRVAQWRQSLPLLAGCALLGFNYIYYAFFASFLLLVAGLAGCAVGRDASVLRRAALGLGTIVACVVLNLAPSWVAAHRHGEPVLIRQKTAIEAEIYGLKIRHLVSPVHNHSWWTFRLWTDRERAAGFPYETENATSRLGLVGTVGFVGLLLSVLLHGSAARRPGALIVGASQLTLAALLLCTVGGFGSLFNLLVAPDIRAYNRVVPFIAFLALFAVATAIDTLARRSRGLAVAAAAAVAAVGMWDQAHALKAITSESTAIATEFSALRTFVARLEATAPDGAAVLQLPFTPYMNDSGRHRMQPYDHFKPYLVSRDLRWSYPALSNAQFAWQDGASQLAPAELASFAAVEGFQLLWIDKHGYEDAGRALIETLRATPGASALVEDTRYSVFDIRNVDRAPAFLTAQRLVELRTDVPTTPGLASCGGAPVFSLSELGAARLPDIRVVIELPAAKKFTIAGWAVAPAGNATGQDVELSIDGKAYSAAYGFDRPDVAAHLQTPAARLSGFIAVLPAGALGPGRHALTVRVLARDGSCFHESQPIAFTTP